MTEPEPKEFSSRPGAILFGLLLLAGALTRIWGAWVFRNTTDPDAGIVQLMAKHVAQGEPWPTFFYGQAYMGSLEPMVSALISFLFGTSGFTVSMGTALLSIACLPVIYLWAKGAAGREAGLAALAYCIIGPYYFYFFQFSPRGGYPAALLLGSLIIWLSCRTIDETKPDATVPFGRLFLLGLLAGLGWWSNQIVVYALGAAGILFLCVLKRRIFNLSLIGGVFGFLLGSLPFWVWNLANDWASFGFLKSPGGGNFREGLRLLTRQRIPALLDLEDGAGFSRHLILGLHGVLIVLSGWLLVQYLLGKKSLSRALYLISPFLFIAIAVFIFCGSHFSRANTARYLIPMVPALAVLLGAGTGWLNRKLPWKLGWIPLLVLIGWQTTHLKALAAKDKAYTTEMESAHELADKLRERQIDSVYVAFMHHWLNFGLKEEFTFAALPDERYTPYALQAEHDDRPAVLSNYKRAAELVLSSRGKAERIRAGQFSFQYDYKPCPEGLQPIPYNRWQSVTDSQSNELRQTIADLDLDTWWHTEAVGDGSEFIEVRFSQPQSVSAVRMQSNTRYGYPKQYSVMGRQPDGEWIALTRTLSVSGFYWSGPRPYYSHGSDYRILARFPARTVSAIRVFEETGDERKQWSLTELQLFGSAENPIPEPEALPELMTMIEDRKIDSLYADRWVANKVFLHFKGAVRTTLDAKLYRKQWSYLNDDINLSNKTGLLVRRENADACRTSLSRREVTMRETEIGPWILFDFAKNEWQEDYLGAQGLQWTGFTCMMGQNRKMAARLLEKAERMRQSRGCTHELAASYARAFEVYPPFIAGFPELPSYLEKAGFSDLSERLNEEMKIRTQPATVCEAEFSNGVRLHGVTLSKTTVHPGESLQFKHFWTCPPAVQTDDLEAFTHIESGKNRFQDDHIFLLHNDQKNISFQPFKEYFVENRILRVPENTVPGTYRIRMGLIVRATGDRLKLRSSQRIDDRAVTIPLTLEVVEKL